MQTKSSPSSASVTARGLLVLVLAMCLVECVTGSCLSYGHSCWGAHGKRSGKSPASAPDWYLTRVLRRMAVNNELNLGKPVGIQTDDDIYRVEDDTPSNNMFISQRAGVAADAARDPEAKPMLDDDVISKMKLWQIMRAGSEEK